MTKRKKPQRGIDGDDRSNWTTYAEQKAKITEEERLAAAEHIALSNSETKEIEMSLDIDLTSDEVVEFAHAASTANRELTAVEMDFDRIKTDFKERIGGKETEIRDALLAIERGKISKRVKCQEVWDYAAKTVKVVYAEKVYAERTMTASELQQDLFPKEPEGEFDENGISKQVIDESHLDASGVGQ